MAVCEDMMATPGGNESYSGATREEELDMGQLELAMLGPFQAVLDGEPIQTFHYEKVRALLAYLVVEPGQMHTRSALAGLFWPEKPEAVARQNLSQALATLRRALKESENAHSFFVTTNHSIQFNNESESDFDTTQFLTLLSQCEEHHHISLAGCDHCLERFRQAVALYRGEFLTDVVVADAPEFYEWTLIQKERYQRLVTDALDRVAGAYEERNDYRAALAYAQHRLDLTPWHEESHRQVMRLLALDGRRLDALHQFEVCRRIMRAEMDIEPETETLALYERIRSGATIEPATQGTLHNLQAQLTPLFGRETELATVTKYLRSSDCRLVVLVGPGGSGKSRLAVEAAQHLLADYADGVFIISLVSLDSAQSLIPAIAQSAGLKMYKGESPATQLQQYLRSKKMLLVLDNFEHLLDGASEISRLLQATHHLRVLVTSRARLNLQAEHIIWLAGLELPAARTEDEGESHDTRPAAAYPAVQLFTYQAQRSAPGFSPNDEEAACIAQICCLVNGIPLSILLAASWMDLLSVKEIAERVSAGATEESVTGIDFLETEWQDVDPRQRSIRTVLDYSWQLLDEPEKRLLAQLSAFRGQFTSEAALQVTGASLRQLRALANRSLLESTQSGMYLLHEHLRQYAIERLAEMAPHSAKTIAHHHAIYYMQRLQHSGDELQGHRQLKAILEITADFGDISAAWQWSVDNADINMIANGLDGLCLFLIWQYRLQEGRQFCAAAADALTSSRSGQNKSVLAETVTFKASFSRLLGDMDEARSLVAEAQGLVCKAEEAGEDVRRTRALVLQEMGHLTFGSMPLEASSMWSESLGLFRDLGDQWRIAQVLNDLSHAMEFLADWDRAHRLSEEAYHIQRALGDRRGVVRSLRGLSVVADNRGRLEEAIAYAEECITISKEMGDLYGVAESELALAIKQMYNGQFAVACSTMEVAEARSAEIGALAHQAWILHFLAWAQTNLCQYTEARKCDEKALSLFTQLSDAVGVAYAHLSLGETWLGENEIGAARRLLELSLAAFRQMGDRDGECLALNSLSCAELADGNLARARKYVSQALGITVDTLDYGPALGAVTAASFLMTQYGDVEKAVELYALVSGHHYIGQSPWRHEVVGRHVADAASTLPANVVTEAKQRGQARDVISTVRELDTECRESGFLLKK